MAPPSKRQKRLVVPSSEKENEADYTKNVSISEQSLSPNSRPRPDATRSTRSETRLLPTRLRPKRSNQDTRPQISVVRPPHVSPPKHSAKHVQKNEVLRPISTFFSQASQCTGNYGQQKIREPKEDTPAIEDDAEEEDQIEDESSAEEVTHSRGSQNTTRSVLDRRKRPTLPLLGNTAQMQSARASLGSQKFKLTSDRLGNGTGTKSSLKAVEEASDLRPWAERYSPINLAELAVHKKKVSDVRDWLESVFQGQVCKRMLIMKGPSGAGKTATISTLAKSMGVELLEWRNPVGSEFSSEGYMSMSAQFGEFLGRSGRFNALPFVNTDNELGCPSSDADIKEGVTRKLILLEEFPNTFMTSSSSLQFFRSTILEYLANETPPAASALSHSFSTKVNITPIVIVVTETRMTTSIAASDIFTVHRLFGSDILTHAGVSTIEFNSMASTLVIKALDLVVQKEARHSGRRRVPSPFVLKKLSEVGDVRSAIGSLEFLCVRAQDSDDWGGRVACIVKNGANASAQTVMEKESLEMVTQRESSLGLFHAVGKVVYNKRNAVSSQDPQCKPLQQLPGHMSAHTRVQIPQISVDQLINETGTDTETFVAALHENYPLSCEGKIFMDSFNGCIDTLSDSDLLSSARGCQFGPNGTYGNRSIQAAAADILRQDEICFHVAVSGLLFALPYPVKRQKHPFAANGTAKSGTFKMFYPTSMRLSRQIEEVTELVDRWSDRLCGGGIFPAKFPGSTACQLSFRKAQAASTDGLVPEQMSPKEEEGSIRLSLNCTKTEMILERLPFLVKMEQRIQGSTLIKELEKITQFHGFNTQEDETSDEEALEEVVHSRSIGIHQHDGNKGKEADIIVLPVNNETVKLYLSDDDIED